MSSKLVPCPECTAQVRKDNLESHLKKVHRKARPAYYREPKYEPTHHYYQDNGYSDYGARYRSYHNHSQGLWDDTQGHSSPKVYTQMRNISSPSPSTSNSRRSSVVSDVSDTASTNTTNTDLSDSRPRSFNRETDLIVFSTPSSAFSQRRNTREGYICPLPGCPKRFTGVDNLIAHVEDKHQLERCPLCTGISFKYSHQLKDHIQHIHPNANKMSNYFSDTQYPSRPSSSGSSSLSNVSVSITDRVIRPSSSGRMRKVPSNTGTNSANIHTIPKGGQNQSTKPPRDNTSLKKQNKGTGNSGQSLSSKEDTNVGVVTKGKVSESKLPTNTGFGIKYEKSAPLAKVKQKSNSHSPPVPATAVMKVYSYNGDSTPLNQENGLSSPNTTASHHITEHTNTHPIDINSDVQSDFIPDRTTSILSNGGKSIQLDGQVATGGFLSLSPEQDNETFLFDYIRDIELDNDPNFRFVNTGDLVGYSLNI